MDPRERERLIVTGGIAAVIILILGILAGQVLGKESELESQIAGKKRTLGKIRDVADEYSKTINRTRNLKARLGGDSPLLSYLENLSRRAGIPNAALKVMRAGENDYFDESIVELKAKTLTLRQVTTLLKLIETSQRYLHIKYFHLKTPYANPELVDITLRVSAYSIKKKKKDTEKNAG